MRKIFYFLPLIFLLFIFPSPARAHPADLYAHNIHVDISQTGLRIEWQIKPGPLLVNFIWNQWDANADGILSEEESNAWAGSYMDLMTATLDDKPLPLLTDSVQLPTDLQRFQAGDEFININFNADWPQGSENAQKLVITNGMEITKSINWYYLNASENAAFLFPTQKNHVITIDLVYDSSLFADQSSLLTSWDSGTPSLPLGQEKDVFTQTAEQVVPELAQQTPQEILLGLLRQKQFSLPFYFFALATALALGALHAITPGHGKTVVAAYLVGSRGTTWHAIVLGSVVTMTHTGSVFLLGLITLAASQYILPTTIIPFLEILSGVLILSLGFYLLWQRFFFWRNSLKTTPAVSFGGNNRKISLTPTSTNKVTGTVKIQKADSSLHHHGDGKMHSHNVPQSITWRSLIALGVSGGLVPCPDAIAILLVAIAINRLLLGLALIISFSLGLAIVLIVIGLLMVNSRRLFDRLGFIDKFAPIMPMVSAIIVLLLGFGLTWGAFVRAKDNVSSSIPGLGPVLSRVEGSVDDARVMYLAEDENRVRHLFITDFNNDNSQMASNEDQNISSYAISPDGRMAAFVSEYDSETSELWLLDLKTMQSTKLSSTKGVTIADLVWSPNSQRIIYEHTDANSSDAVQTTLWWINVKSGDDQPVFQGAGVPGRNPSWSPNGEWISYASDDGIRLYHLEDGQSRLIKNILGATAEWSPDSKKVLLRDVVIEHDQFVTQLFLYDIETETLTNLDPNSSVENLFAAWSPTGEYIAVLRRDLSVPRGDQIWLMDADGSNAHALTNTPDVIHGNLHWSPDGKYLLYDLFVLENYPFDYSLQVINMDKEEVVELGIKGFNPKWIWK